MGLAVSTTDATLPVRASIGRAAQSSPGPRRSDSRWRWPASGPLVSEYGVAGGVSDGIGIGGHLGADVRAAASGEVVYAGRGLAVYGRLVILRHDDMFLSAYGHNGEERVVEGERVAQRQVIAAMGLGPDRQPQVHFEIRRNGTPVNPMDYLPR